MSRWLALAKGSEIETQTPPDNMTIPDKTPATRQERGFCRVLSNCQVGAEEFSEGPQITGRADYLGRTAKDSKRHETFDGTPKTWTGEIVSLADWRKLSEWEKHGPGGRLWNGITKEWELPE